MKFDPLDKSWEEPKQLNEWGKQCVPPLEVPWLSHINFERSPVDLLSVGRFLMPTFIEFQNGIFLEMQFSEDGFDEWFQKLDDLCAVEQMINHVHVYDVFGNAPNATEEEFVQAARLIHKTWEIALSVTFPDDNFDVNWHASDADYGPTVTFRKVR